MKQCDKRNQSNIPFNYSFRFKSILGALDERFRALSSKVNHLLKTKIRDPQKLLRKNDYSTICQHVSAQLNNSKSL